MNYFQQEEGFIIPDSSAKILVKFIPPYSGTFCARYVITFADENHTRVRNSNSKTL